jgi:hypothetical protein
MSLFLWLGNCKEVQNRRLWPIRSVPITLFDFIIFHSWNEQLTISFQTVKIHELFKLPPSFYSFPCNIQFKLPKFDIIFSRFYSSLFLFLLEYFTRLYFSYLNFFDCFLEFNFYLKLFMNLLCFYLRKSFFGYCNFIEISFLDFFMQLYFALVTCFLRQQLICWHFKLKNSKLVYDLLS